MMLDEEEVQSRLIGYYTPALDEVRDGLRISTSSDYEVWASVGTESGEVHRAAIIYDAQLVNGKTVLRADKLDADQVAELTQSGELKIAQGMVPALDDDRKHSHKVAMHR